MHEHVIAFIGALRGAGVRVSLAESLDALRAAAEAGIASRAEFRAALATTLVKDRADRPTFERLFAAYFGEGGPALAPADDGSLSPADLERLGEALRSALAGIAAPGLAALFRAMVEGRAPSEEQAAAMLAGVSPIWTGNPLFRAFLTQRAARELGFERLDDLLGDLLARLRAAGLDEGAVGALEARARANQAALAEQVGRAVSRRMLLRASESRPPPRPADELLDLPFRLLGPHDAEELRALVARLAAQLRTRAALRRRRARSGPLDPRRTIRASMAYGGVPFAMRRRRRHLRPRLVVLCDVSSSMRAAAAFMLSLVYALHDQLGGTRAFAYIDELHDVSADFADARPGPAIAAVLARIRADYARTDLGFCLDEFARRHLSAVDRRTTVLILGDGRNNGGDPGVGSLRQIRARARRLIWLNPEPRRDWGGGDSDMLAYEPLCDRAHVVGSLRQLAGAIEDLF